MKLTITCISVLVLILFFSSCSPFSSTKFLEKPVLDARTVRELKSSTIKLSTPDYFLKWIYRKDEEEGLKSKISLDDCILGENYILFLSQHSIGKDEFIDLVKVNEKGDYQIGKSIKLSNSRILYQKFYSTNQMLYLVLAMESANNQNINLQFIPIHVNDLSIDFTNSSGFYFSVFPKGQFIQDDSIFVYGYINEDLGNNRSLSKPFIGKFIEREGTISLDKSFVFQYPFFGHQNENVFGGEINSLLLDEQKNMFFFSEKGYMGKLDNKGEFLWIKKIPDLEYFVNTFYISKQIFVHNGTYMFSLDANGNLLHQGRFPKKWDNSFSGFNFIFPGKDGFIAFGEISDDEYEVKKSVAFHLSPNLEIDFTAIIDGIFFYPSFVKTKNDFLYVAGNRDIDEPSSLYQGYNGNCFGFMKNSMRIQKWLEPGINTSSNLTSEEIKTIWDESNKNSTTLTKNKDGFSFTTWNERYYGERVVIQDKSFIQEKRGTANYPVSSMSKLVISNKTYPEFTPIP